MHKSSISPTAHSCVFFPINDSFVQRLLGSLAADRFVVMQTDCNATR